MSSLNSFRRRRIKEGSLTLGILAFIALALALALVDAYYRDGMRPLHQPPPELPPNLVKAVGGVTTVQAEGIARRVFSRCPLLSRGFNEMHDLEVGPAIVAQDAKAGSQLEFRFTAPEEFSLLPEGLPRVFASNQTCHFLVDTRKRLVETSQPACDLICTASLPVQVAGAHYQHTF